MKIDQGSDKTIRLERVNRDLTTKLDGLIMYAGFQGTFGTPGGNGMTTE